MFTGLKSEEMINQTLIDAIEQSVGLVRISSNLRNVDRIEHQVD